MTAVQSAIIIGGGIAGTVVATALQRSGIAAIVYEAYPEPSGGIGSALALAPNGLAALAIIGADEAVRSRSLPITRSVMSMRSRPTGTMPSLKGLAPQRMIQRSALHDVLRARADAVGVEVHYGRRLVEVREHSQRVTAEFADGTSAEADILIGADGVRSLVRSLIDPHAPGADYTGLLSFSATVPADDLPGARLEPVGTITFAFGARAYYLYWRNADGSLTWGANLPSAQYLSLTQARAVPAEEWLQQLRETYAGDHPGEQLAAATTADLLEVQGAIHLMPPVPHWYRERLVLVGDAVHCPSNSTGQGASLAIESAIELARCLRDLPDPESAFAAYVGLRRDRVESITRRGARLNRPKAPSGIAAHAMRLAMPWVFRMMNPEKVFGPEQRFTIPWDSPVMT